MVSTSTSKKEQPLTSAFVKYIGPVVDALRELGGSGRPDEVREVIARRLHISDQEQSEPLPSGVQSRFENRVHWARFHLAKAGYIDGWRRSMPAGSVPSAQGQAADARCLARALKAKQF